MTNVATDSGAGGDAGKALENLLTDGPTVRRAGTPKTSNEEGRFSGKSREQILEMYSNLESHSGRLASQLGQTQQQLTEALAVAKRNADLRDHSSPRASEKTLNGMELIADPTKALDEYLSERERAMRSETDGRINRLEAELNRTRLERNHPDAQQLLNDPAVSQFAQGTPLRQALAARVQQGDASAADALLTEYKQYKATVVEPKTNEGAANADRVSLESVRASADATSGGGGKIYKRADIRALMQKDPETYYSEAVQSALIRAHREGRVRD